MSNSNIALANSPVIIKPDSGSINDMLENLMPMTQVPDDQKSVAIENQLRKFFAVRPGETVRQAVKREVKSNFLDSFTEAIMAAPLEKPKVNFSQLMTKLIAGIKNRFSQAIASVKVH